MSRIQLAPDQHSRNAPESQPWAQSEPGQSCWIRPAFTPMSCCSQWSTECLWETHKQAVALLQCLPHSNSYLVICCPWTWRLHLASSVNPDIGNQAYSFAIRFQMRAPQAQSTSWYMLGCDSSGNCLPAGRKANEIFFKNGFWYFEHINIGSDNYDNMYINVKQLSLRWLLILAAQESNPNFYLLVLNIHSFLPGC